MQQYCNALQIGAGIIVTLENVYAKFCFLASTRPTLITVTSRNVLGCT